MLYSMWFDFSIVFSAPARELNIILITGVRYHTMIVVLSELAALDARHHQKRRSNFHPGFVSDQSLGCSLQEKKRKTSQRSSSLTKGDNIALASKIRSKLDQCTDTCMECKDCFLLLSAADEVGLESRDLETVAYESSVLRASIGGFKAAMEDLFLPNFRNRCLVRRFFFLNS